MRHISQRNSLTHVFRHVHFDTQCTTAETANPSGVCVRVRATAAGVFPSPRGDDDDDDDVSREVAMMVDRSRHSNVVFTKKKKTKEKHTCKCFQDLIKWRWENFIFRWKERESE